jgi:hypothetical protein
LTVRKASGHAGENVSDEPRRLIRDGIGTPERVHSPLRELGLREKLFVKIRLGGAVSLETVSLVSHFTGRVWL